MKRPQKHSVIRQQIDYQTILSAIGDAVTVQNLNGHIIYQNPASIKIIGDAGISCPAGEEKIAVDSNNSVISCFMDGCTHTSECTIYVNGNQRTFESRTAPLIDDNGHFYAAVESLRDISSHKQTEKRLTRYMNMYAALSHTNKAIIESKSRKELFDRVCAATVEFGKFPLSAIGLIEEDGMVRSVSHCGVASNYLNKLDVYADADKEEGRGPTGRAIHNGAPYICNDYHNDPATTPWRIATQQIGIRAAAAFPLRLHEKVVGILRIYSDHVHYFDEEITNLLTEMAANISFGLENFSKEDQRRVSEKALRYSEEQLKLVLEGSNDGFIDWDIPSSTLQMSSRYLEMLGYGKNEIIPSPTAIKELIHPEDWPQVAQLLDEEQLTNHPAFETEVRMLTKTGEWKWILYRGKVVEQNEYGMTTRVAGTCTDITGKKRCEEQLRYASTHDQLTGLYNRAYFDAEFTRIKDGRDFPVSIIIADVDELKQVNDKFGHAEGDRLLQLAAMSLRESFRANDAVARIGGDEFAVILPNADTEIAKQSIKRVLAYQAKIGTKLNGIALSISIGSATASSREQLNETLSQADSQMYQYKLIRKSRKSRT